MNLLLLDQADLIAPDRARLAGRRLEHLREILGSQRGDTLRAGLLGGLMGTATVLRIDAREAELALALDTPPPAPLPVTLVVALPRPKQLRRIVRSVAEFGVKALYLIHSQRVEKSYWQSPLLQPEQLEHYARLGLEQARDTELPRIHLRRRFKPFAEDELPALAAGRCALVAHPGTGQAPDIPRHQPALLAIGPEGGFIPYEVALLQAAGLQALDLGPRILRVENAVAAGLARFG